MVYSKHLHIFLAPVNVLFSRRPNALGPLEPMRSGGKVLDFEEADPDTDVFGLGKIEDFTWKGLLDMGTCTECGRCQSQCPAWATGKPLSPKQVILDLRDHAFAKAPYLLADRRGPGEAPGHASRRRPSARWSADEEAGGVIDPDVIWSCTNCGACVEECPVDIEHIDHIDGMRRHQVLIESAFPVEAAGMLKNLENKGDPWGMGDDPPRRLDHRARLRGPGRRRADRPGRRVPVLGGMRGRAGGPGQEDHQGHRHPAAPAGVSFAVLGPGRDLHRGPGPADRQRVRVPMLAAQNIETLNEAGAEDDRGLLPALLQHDRE